MLLQKNSWRLSHFHAISTTLLWVPPESSINIQCPLLYIELINSRLLSQAFSTKEASEGNKPTEVTGEQTKKTEMSQLFFLYETESSFAVQDFYFFFQLSFLKSYFCKINSMFWFSHHQFSVKHPGTLQCLSE